MSIYITFNNIYLPIHSSQTNQSYHTSVEMEELIYSKHKKLENLINKNPKEWEKDNAELKKHNIPISTKQIENMEITVNAIFNIVERRIIDAFQLNINTQRLLSFSNIFNCYSPVATFDNLIQSILYRFDNDENLKQKIEKKSHMILSVANSGMSTADISKIPTVKLPRLLKYSQLTYFLYSQILGDVVKINDAKSFNNLFAHYNVMATLTLIDRENAVSFVKGSCYEKKETVEHIDKILYILQEIDNQLDKYISELKLSDVVKEYITYICKYSYFSCASVYLARLLLLSSSKNNYKNLTNIEFDTNSTQ